MLESGGLRVSLAGGIVVAIALVALLLLPDTVPAIAMMVGGLAVIGGFMATLAKYYLPPGPRDE